MEQERTPSYYAIIPSNVRYDEKLSDGAKLLYGEISALCNKKGFCWANNKYFAELYKTSERTISRRISGLEAQGHIKTNFRLNENNKQSSERCISILPIDNSVYPIDKNVVPPIDKNVYHNNTSINNIYSSSQQPDGCPDKQKIFNADSKQYKAAKYLDNQICKRLPTKNPSNEIRLQSWAIDFDRLNRLDGQSWEDIGEVLRFSQTDSFWQSIILSGKKFREKYDQLYLKMQNRSDTA